MIWKPLIESIQRLEVSTWGNNASLSGKPVPVPPLPFALIDLEELYTKPFLMPLPENTVSDIRLVVRRSSKGK